MPTFDKKILDPGVYYPMTPDGKRVRRNFGSTTFRRWVKNFDDMRQAGLNIPAPWRHDPKAEPVRLTTDKSDVDGYNNGGFWKKLWIDEKDALWGTVESERDEDASRIGTTVKECSPLAKTTWKDGSLREYDDCLTHIALVTHPIAGGQENFFPSTGETDPTAIAAAIAMDCDGIALSMDDLWLSAAQMQRLQTAEETPPTAPAATNTGPVMASNPTLNDVIDVLRELGVGLPDDTTEENILERLMVAAVAIKAAKTPGEETETVPTSPPAKAVQQKPSPIVMSFDPTTGKITQVEEQATATPGATEAPTPAPTGDEPAVAMSNDQQAMLNFAHRTASDRYLERVRTVIGRKIPQQTAEKHLKPFLVGLQQGQIALSFSSEDGSCVAGGGELDRMLALIEDLPDFAAMGQASSIMELSKTGDRFQLSQAQEEPGDDLWAGSGADMTEEEADKIVDQQMANAGMHNLVRPNGRNTR